MFRYLLYSKDACNTIYFIWSRGSDTIYNTVTKTNSKDLKGANMGDEVTPELENTYNAKRLTLVLNYLQKEKS